MGHSSSQPLLRLLFWETTIRCNLCCAHCRRVESEEAADRDLSTAQGRELIGQLTELGKQQRVMPVLVFSGGEPLCRPDLFSLVRHARAGGIIPALATNGTLVDWAVARQIRDGGITRVAVSLDGATAEVHDGLRKVEGAFAGAIEGIKHLDEAGVAFQINVTLTRHNVAQLEGVYELARSLGAVALHIFLLVPVGCGQVLAETDMLSAQQYEQALVRICEFDEREQLEVKVTCAPHYERIIREQGLYQRRGVSAKSGRAFSGRGGHGGQSRGCLAGLGVLFVGHQGDVFPCGYLPIPCGNVVRQRLCDIWFNNEDLARIRDSNRLEGKCGICSYRHVCGGCRGRAYGKTGNYMAEEPFCAYIPPGVAG